MAKAQSSEWGATTSQTDDVLSIKRIFNNYCATWQVDDDGHKVYLDPVCNIIANDVHCRKASLFDRSRVDQGDHPGLTGALTKIGDQCRCYGAPYNYVWSNLNTPPRSFIWKWQDIEGCGGELSINICNTTMSANRLDIEGSSIIQNCGADAYTVEDEGQEEEGGGRKRKGMGGRGRKTEIRYPEETSTSCWGPTRNTRKHVRDQTETVMGLTEALEKRKTDHHHRCTRSVGTLIKLSVLVLALGGGYALAMKKKRARNP